MDIGYLFPGLFSKARTNPTRAKKERRNKFINSIKFGYLLLYGTRLYFARVIALTIVRKHPFDLIRRARIGFTVIPVCDAGVRKFGLTINEFIFTMDRGRRNAVLAKKRMYWVIKQKSKPPIERKGRSFKIIIKILTVKYLKWIQFQIRICQK